MTAQTPGYTPVIVLGAGPAGLSVTYELIRRGVEPLVLEKGKTVGASFAAFPRNIFFGPWLNNLLPGSSIDWTWLLKRSTQPAYTKYLQDYAHQNRLPIRTGVTVHHVRRDGELFLLDTSMGPLSCHLLVNATGYFSNPFTPEVPGLDSTRVPVMHVSEYRDPRSVSERLKSGEKVLVVGKRLSAGETMVELHKAGYEVSLSHRGTLKFGPSQFLEALWSPLDWIWERVNVALRRRKHSYPRMAGGESERLVRSGAIRTYPDLARFETESVVFEDGREACFDLVIFATGYRPTLNHLGELLGAPDREPVLRNMEARDVPGLFFVGLDQQRTYRSRFLRGIVEDSRFVAELVARRARRVPQVRREEGVQPLTFSDRDQLTRARSI